MTMRFLPALLLAGALAAQTPAPDVQDQLGRTTPQNSMIQFLEACHAQDYKKALLYLDLRTMPPAQRAKDGPELAQQLEDLLDDTAFEITALSRVPEGDEADGLGPNHELLATYEVGGQMLNLELERVQL